MLKYNMERKWAPILHWASLITVTLGIFALLSWWIVLFKLNGFSLMFEPDHLYKDAIALLLLSIAFGLGTLIHHYEERGKK